jgi:excisionase family DNA binding protein
MSRRVAKKESAEIQRLAYSISEAAVALGVSERTIKRRLADGSLPKIKRLGAVRIPVKALVGEAG